jgi:hypothetical protein
LRRRKASPFGSEKKRSPPKPSPAITAREEPEATPRDEPTLGEVSFDYSSIMLPAEETIFPSQVAEHPLVQTLSLFAQVSQLPEALIEMPSALVPLLPLLPLGSSPTSLIGQSESLESSSSLLLSPLKRGGHVSTQNSESVSAKKSKLSPAHDLPLLVSSASPPPAAATVPGHVNEEESSDDNEWNYFSVIFPSDRLSSKFEHLREFVGRRFTDLEAPKNDPFKYGCVTDIVQLEGRGPYLFRFYNYLKHSRRVPSLRNGDCWAFQGCEELIREQENHPLYLWH